jgi:hypothetical protein
MNSEEVPSSPRPTPARLIITPASRNLRLGAPRRPPPMFPAEGTHGLYISDTGPLLALGLVPSRLELAVEHFGDRIRVPAKVAEELQRLRGRNDSAVERAAAAQAVRAISSGIPVVETLTTTEAELAEGRLLVHLMAMPQQLTGHPSGHHLGECHAVALALRFGAESTIVLTNDGRAGQLARANGICARSINGLLRELVLDLTNDYTAQAAWEDVQMMQSLSAPPASDRARGPEDLC